MVPSWRRRGIGTEACRALIESAWERGADVIVVHTVDPQRAADRSAPEAWVRAVRPPEPGVLAFTRRRAHERPDVGISGAAALSRISSACAAYRPSAEGARVAAEAGVGYETGPSPAPRQPAVCDRVGRLLLQADPVAG